MYDKRKHQIQKTRRIILLIAGLHILIAGIIYTIFVKSIGPSALIQLANIVFYLPVLAVLEIARLVIRFLETENVAKKVSSVILILINIVAPVILFSVNFHTFIDYGIMLYIYGMAGSLFVNCWYCSLAWVLGYSIDWIVFR